MGESTSEPAPEIRNVCCHAKEKEERTFLGFGLRVTQIINQIVKGTNFSNFEAIGVL